MHVAQALWVLLMIGLIYSYYNDEQKQKAIEAKTKAKAKSE